MLLVNCGMSRDDPSSDSPSIDSASRCFDWSVRHNFDWSARQLERFDWLKSCEAEVRIISGSDVEIESKVSDDDIAKC